MSRPRSPDSRLGISAPSAAAFITVPARAFSRLLSVTALTMVTSLSAPLITFLPERGRKMFFSETIYMRKMRMNLSNSVNYYCMHGVPYGTYCSYCTTTLVPSVPPSPPSPQSAPPQGWECPKCFHVFSPFIHICLYCPGKEANQSQKGDPKVTTDAANS